MRPCPARPNTRTARPLHADTEKRVPIVYNTLLAIKTPTSTARLPRATMCTSTRRLAALLRGERAICTASGRAALRQLCGSRRDLVSQAGLGVASPVGGPWGSPPWVRCAAASRLRLARKSERADADESYRRGPERLSLIIDPVHTSRSSWCRATPTRNLSPLCAQRDLSWDPKGGTHHRIVSYREGANRRLAERRSSRSSTPSPAPLPACVSFRVPVPGCAGKARTEKCGEGTHT